MKGFRFMTAVLGLSLAATAWASPVKVWHDLQENKPSLVRAEGVIKAPPEAVWNYLIRFNEYANFMPRVSESFFISQAGVEALRQAGTQNANKIKMIAKKYKAEMPRKAGQSWEGLVFMVLNLPFPVENRWYVLKAVQDETRAGEHIYKRCWSLVIGNIDGAKGCWTLEPANGGSETLGRYEDQVDPGGKLPDWAAKMGATQIVPEMFESLEKVAAAE